MWKNLNKWELVSKLPHTEHLEFKTNKWGDASPSVKAHIWPHFGDTIQQYMYHTIPYHMHDMHTFLYCNLLSFEFSQMQIIMKKKMFFYVTFCSWMHFAMCVWFKYSEPLESVASYVYLEEGVHYASWEKGIIVSAGSRAEQSFFLGMFGKCEWWSVPQDGLCWLDELYYVCIWVNTLVCGYSLCTFTPTPTRFFRKPAECCNPLFCVWLNPQPVWSKTAPSLCLILTLNEHSPVSFTASDQYQL